MKIRFELEEDDVERIALRTAIILEARSKTAELNPPTMEFTAADGTAVEQQQGLVPRPQERKPPREFYPVQISSCARQAEHMKVAKFLARRVNPIKGIEIAERLGLEVRAVSQSLLYLKRRDLVEQPGGEGTHQWVASARLRSRGVVAA